MANRNYTVKYKRKAKTSYKKRLKLISSEKIRLVIRKSTNNISIQFVDFNIKGDKIITGANSFDLIKLGYKNNRGNTPSAYLTGLLAGKKAKEKKVKEAILDIGRQKTSERIYAALKGVLDADIQVNHSDKIIPIESRLKGEHIKDSKYSQNNFEEVKNKILKTK